MGYENCFVIRITSWNRAQRKSIVEAGAAILVQSILLSLPLGPILANEVLSRSMSLSSEITDSESVRGINNLE